MSLASKYRREIRSWNWDAVVAGAKTNPQEDGEGNTVGMQFLGTVFEIMPSGKFYMPFACSNVAGDCPTCLGSGMRKRKIICPYCLGEGMRQTPLHCAEDRSSPWFGQEIIPCWCCDGSGRYGTTCTTCNGLGSLSAYRDEVYGEVLNSVAESRGGWVEGGEGDPCDIFFCMHLAGEEVGKERKGGDLKCCY